MINKKVKRNVRSASFKFLAHFNNAKNIHFIFHYIQPSLLIHLKGNNRYCDYSLYVQPYYLERKSQYNIFQNLFLDKIEINYIIPVAYITTPILSLNKLKI